MKILHQFWFLTFLGIFLIGSLRSETLDGRYLYVAVPGVRNYLEYGGHGVLVFDMDKGHSLVKRIPTAGLDEKGLPLNVKGLCASEETGRLYISTLQTLTCLDLHSESILWEKKYEGGCDRMAISPDGQLIYLPSLEKAHWHVVDALTGDVLKKITTHSGAHNTVYGPNGQEVYLAGLLSPYLFVADTRLHEANKKVGPFSASIRPFTINSDQSLCFVNVNFLLGFEVGNLRTAKMLHRVEVAGFKQGPVKRHGCPSHGVALTPDEKELWLTDAANEHLHIFDARQMPPRQTESIKLRDQPGWITFSIKGDLAYPSTGDVIDVKSKRIKTHLTAENGMAVQSEKMLEVDFKKGKVVRVGDQFGLGRK